jgi:hypothetical protein
VVGRAPRGSSGRLGRPLRRRAAGGTAVRIAGCDADTSSDRLHEWPSSWPPAHCEATGHCLSEPFRGRLGVLQTSHGRRGDGSSSSSTTSAHLVWCQRCVGRIRGHRAVRMLRTSGRMGPGGPPTGTETSTFVLRVRACACVRVRLCLRAGGIVCMRARQARPGRGGRSIRN